MSEENDDDALSDQKHLLLLVQNYDGSNAASAGSPLTYVKLGSAKSADDLDTDGKRGDDLCESAGISSDSYEGFFIDDARGEACDEVEGGHAADYAQHTHYDSEHESADCLDAEVLDAGTTYYRSTKKGEATTEDENSELSAELLGAEEDDKTTYARGGWRDHTDGNRIVTVRGDRVDVVYGNYKRVVFGRVSGDEVGASCYEAAGGHIFERTSSGAMEEYAIERVRETAIDGADYWKVVEAAHHVDSVLRFSGKLTQHHNGPVHKVVIGVDALDDDKNPEIERRHNIGAFSRHVTADSFEGSLEVDEGTDTTHGDHASFKETTMAVVYHRARGKHDHRNFTYKRELWSECGMELNGFIGWFDSMIGGARFDDEIDTYRVQMGIEIEAFVGVRAKWHYGTKWHIHFPPSSVIRATAGAAFDVFAGLVGHTSFMFWNYEADHSHFEMWGLDIHCMERDDGLVRTKALGMMMQL